MAMHRIKIIKIKPSKASKPSNLLYSYYSLLICDSELSDLSEVSLSQFVICT